MTPEEPVSFEGYEIAASGPWGQALRPPRNDDIHRIEFDRVLGHKLAVFIEIKGGAKAPPFFETDFDGSIIRWRNVGKETDIEKRFVPGDSGK